MLTALPPTLRSESSSNQPWRILIVGAAYGGITALMHFIDLCNGRTRPSHRDDLPKFEGEVPERGVNVTVIDERDGFCMFDQFPFCYFSLVDDVQPLVVMPSCFATCY